MTDIRVDNLNLWPAHDGNINIQCMTDVHLKNIIKWATRYPQRVHQPIMFGRYLRVVEEANRRGLLQDPRRVPRRVHHYEHLAF